MRRASHPRILVLATTIGVITAACGGIGSNTPIAPSTTATPAVTATSVMPTTTSSTTTTTTDPGFTQVEGEIFLEAAGSEGPDSFTGELFAEPATTSTSTTVATTPPAEPSGPATVTAVAGDTPALYGGSRDRATCDKEGQLRFLDQNPDKAAAFVATLNSDPNLMWSGGTSLAVAQLPDYWDELTPMILTRDTRVTNHGYRNGRPTPRQAVLQAGTAVLVDAYGVPRARCECGNPLIPPQPVQVTPVYTGTAWSDFSPDTIVVVSQTTVIINVFVLIDIVTGEEFVRPAGSIGAVDASSEASVWQIDVDVVETGDDYSMPVAWTGEFTIADDLTISGGGQGTWRFDGDCTTGDTGEWVATVASQGTFTIVLDGLVTTTEAGRVASIVPSYGNVTITSETWTSSEPDCVQDLHDSVESWVAESLAPIEGVVVESEDVFASYESEGFSGSVILTPIS